MTKSMNTILQDSYYVNYHGFLSKNSLHHLYEDVDVVVIPSLREPFGLVVLEGMLSNGIVICSDSGGFS